MQRGSSYAAILNRHTAAHEFVGDGLRDEAEPPPDGLRQLALHGGRQVAPEGVGDVHHAAASFVVAVMENISDATDLEQLVLRDERQEEEATAA